MFRLPVSAKLGDDNALPVLLQGGIWPTDDGQASSMSRDDYPTAFDSVGRILPTALVQDDGSFALPNIERALNGVFRVFVWQAFGRETITAALKQIRDILDGAQIVAGSLWVYEVQWLGDGPNLRDQALDDAEFGWARFQVVATR